MKTRQILLSLAVLASLLTATFAGQSYYSVTDIDNRHQVRCPRCHTSCQLEIEKGKEKKSCWEIECKAICIPKVTFPWQKCCQPKCAKVKYVNVLKKKTWECEVCKTKWNAVCSDCACDATPTDTVSPAPKPPAPVVNLEVKRVPPVVKSIR